MSQKTDEVLRRGGDWLISLGDPDVKLSKEDARALNRLIYDLMQEVEGHRKND